MPRCATTYQGFAPILIAHPCRHQPFFRGSFHTRGFLYNSCTRRTDILVLRSHQTCLLFIYIVSGGRSFAHLSLGEGEALTRVPGDLIRVNPFGRLHNSSQSIKTAFSSENPEKVPSHCSIVSQGEALGRSSRGGKTLAGLIGFQPLQTKSPLQEEEQEGTYEGGRSKGGKTFSC